ncbi:hypothetical protein BDR26DRAFT_66757 [Obelidium mucronatum]|nr:hypothetical protein BDR26DRAFT_66757 [Obelidium mucronatum]
MNNQTFPQNSHGQSRLPPLQQFPAAPQGMAGGGAFGQQPTSSPTLPQPGQSNTSSSPISVSASQVSYQSINPNNKTGYYDAQQSYPRNSLPLPQGMVQSSYSSQQPVQQSLPNLASFVQQQNEPLIPSLSTYNPSYPSQSQSSNLQSAGGFQSYTAVQSAQPQLPSSSSSYSFIQPRSPTLPPPKGFQSYNGSQQSFSNQQPYATTQSQLPSQSLPPPPAAHRSPPVNQRMPNPSPLSNPANSHPQPQISYNNQPQSSDSYSREYPTTFTTRVDSPQPAKATLPSAPPFYGLPPPPGYQATQLPNPRLQHQQQQQQHQQQTQLQQSPPKHHQYQPSREFVIPADDFRIANSPRQHQQHLFSNQQQQHHQPQPQPQHQQHQQQKQHQHHHTPTTPGPTTTTLSNLFRTTLRPRRPHPNRRPLTPAPQEKRPPIKSRYSATTPIP